MSHFLKVDICSTNMSDFLKWEGIVSSRIRKQLFDALADYLEGHDVRPLPVEFESTVEKYK